MKKSQVKNKKMEVEVRKLVKKWVKKLKLERWKLSIEFTTVEENSDLKELGSDIFAATYACLDQLDAAIVFNARKLELLYEEGELEKVIKDEVLHILFAPMCAAFEALALMIFKDKKAKETVDDLWTQREHEAIQILKELL